LLILLSSFQVFRLIPDCPNYVTSDGTHMIADFVFEEKKKMVS
jgi:hypothetical protein